MTDQTIRNSGLTPLPSRRMLLRQGLGLGGAIAGLGVLDACTASNPGYSDQQRLVDKARITVNEFRADKLYGNAPDLFRRARAVMLVPELVKAGFFFGGEGGNAVLMARLPNGSWSYPAFYSIGSFSFGLQIGIEAASVVLIVMTERALQAWMADQFTLGAKASLAIVTIGSNVSASTTTAIDGADLIAWSKASGAYAGLTLEGALIQQRFSYNEAYYGRPASGQEITRGMTQNPGAEELRAALMR